MSNVIQFPRKQPTLAELELELFRAVNGYDGQQCNAARILSLRDSILRHWTGERHYYDEGGGSAA